ncbi:hypothetical protein J2X90_001852 [Variovorax paradoxus]|nr:hypothetical protein [Variovorax paradoxus]
MKDLIDPRCALLPPLPGEGWGGGKRHVYRALCPAPIPTFPRKGKEQDRMLGGTLNAAH